MSNRYASSTVQTLLNELPGCSPVRMSQTPTALQVSVERRFPAWCRSTKRE
jgi:hypothetical protein